VHQLVNKKNFDNIKIRGRNVRKKEVRMSVSIIHIVSATKFLISCMVRYCRLCTDHLMMDNYLFETCRE